MKTEGEILQAIEIHTKSRATRKVALLEQELARLRGDFVDPEAKADEETAKEFTALVSKEVETVSGDLNGDSGDVVYDMHALGDSWAEITARTGVKVPWLKAKAYAKANDLPYPANKSK